MLTRKEMFYIGIVLTLILIGIIALIVFLTSCKKVTLPIPPHSPTLNLPQGPSNVIVKELLGPNVTVKELLGPGHEYGQCIVSDKHKIIYILIPKNMSSTMRSTGAKACENKWGDCAPKPPTSSSDFKMGQLLYFLVYDDNTHNGYLKKLLKSVEIHGKQFKIIIFNKKK